MSVAQFRPEKNHSMQLRAFALARQLAMASAPSKAGEQGSRAVLDLGRGGARRPVFHYGA